ncbi:MAG: thiol:disulfide interchange protein DsbA/DsbL [Betaproteobacteria bacterium]
MRATRRGLFGFLLGVILGAWIGSPVSAQPIQPGVDYRVLSRTQPVPRGNRIEVIEFFFYPCPYCNELAPEVERWQKTLPPDVVFRRSPVVRHDSWVPLAIIYFALETLGEVARLHLAVYQSFHTDHLQINREPVVETWAAKNSLDGAKFMASYRSAEVQLKVDLARKMTLDYEVQAMPSFVVDGRYITSTSMTSNVPQVLSVVDALIRFARRNRADIPIR